MSNMDKLGTDTVIIARFGSEIFWFFARKGGRNRTQQSSSVCFASLFIYKHFRGMKLDIVVMAERHSYFHFSFQTN